METKPIKIETMKIETMKTEKMKTETMKTEPMKTETMKTETMKSKLMKTKTMKTETMKTKTMKTETMKTEPRETQLNRLFSLSSPHNSFFYIFSLFFLFLFSAMETSAVNVSPMDADAVGEVQEDSFSVTYYVAGIRHVVKRPSGGTLNLESPAASGGMGFFGWSMVNSAENPFFVQNSMAVTEDMVLYAVFTVSAERTVYQRVAEVRSDYRGRYLIVGTGANGFLRVANGKVGGTGDNGIGSTGSVKTPSTSDYDAVADEFTTSWGDGYYVTLEAVDDGDLSKNYVLRTQDGLYNYATATSTLTTSKNKDTAAGHPVKVWRSPLGDMRVYIKFDNGETKRFLYDKSVFRFRAQNVTDDTAIRLYKRTVVPAVYSMGAPDSVVITSAKFATFCSARALDFSGTRITPYRARVEDETVVLARIADGIVPAGEGVILYKDVEEGTASEKVVVPFCLSEQALEGNELVGTTERVKVCKHAEDGRYNYVLQLKEGKPVFNMAKENGAWMPANRAYLSTKVCAEEARMSTMFSEEETTGMDVKASQQTRRGEKDGREGCDDIAAYTTEDRWKKERGWFDLNGRRVMTPKKGVYVRNGKMVIR